ncbi:hypothetical protein J6590_026243 [Homalodisca vitripennis]|nr:hypothetical protein J6590_026243 [Homalodisca vitripennis]
MRNIEKQTLTVRELNTRSWWVGKRKISDDFKQSEEKEAQCLAATAVYQSGRIRTQQLLPSPITKTTEQTSTDEIRLFKAPQISSDKCARLKLKIGLARNNDGSGELKVNGDAEEYCTVRHFSISGRKVVNRGDSFKVKKSTSGHSVASIGSTGNDTESPRMSPTPPAPYSVAVLGAPSVGKSSLVSQFMTSDFLHAFETFTGDRSDKTVTVLLDGEESELTFTDLPYAILKRRDLLQAIHGFCVVYSVTDRASFHQAELTLQQLAADGSIDHKAVILVANKVDLARGRTVSEQEGRILATACNCKFIECSVVICHHVDELLVGLVAQMRLKLGVAAVGTAGSVGTKRGRKYRGAKTSSSFRGILNKLRLTKSNSCHKLHVL